MKEWKVIMPFAISWRYMRSYKISNVIYARYGLTYQQAIRFRSHLLRTQSKNGQEIQSQIHDLGYMKFIPLFYQKFLVWRAYLPRVRDVSPKSPSIIRLLFGRATMHPEE